MNIKLISMLLIFSLVLTLAGIGVYSEVNKNHCSNQRLVDSANLEEGNIEKVYYDKCYFEETGILRRLEQ